MGEGSQGREADESAQNCCEAQNRKGEERNLAQNAEAGSHGGRLRHAAQREPDVLKGKEPQERQPETACRPRREMRRKSGRRANVPAASSKPALFRGHRDGPDAEADDASDGTLPANQWGRVPGARRDGQGGQANKAAAPRRMSAE